MEQTGALREHFTRPASANTFLIKILYTQHSSIQGILEWVDQERALPFRSFMELIHLIEEALRVREDMGSFRSWQEADKPQIEWR